MRHGYSRHKSRSNQLFSVKPAQEVTSIAPNAAILTQGQGNLATTSFRTSLVCLNGNDKLTGISFINEF